nr:MAG TPA: hypothetical protein [Caudoviricetes sp.]
MRKQLDPFPHNSQFFLEGFTLTSGLIAPSIVPCSASYFWILSLIRTRM